MNTFILIVLGQIVSLFGNAALRFALPLYLLRQTGSAGPIPPHCTAVSQRWPLCRCCWARWQGACWQTAAVKPV